MTYMELSQYLNDLQEAGLEVDHLRTDLHTKIALPFVSLIMTILGVPFALSIGRKGALHGIAVGVSLGIFYWGAFGVFRGAGWNQRLAGTAAGGLGTQPGLRIEQSHPSAQCPNLKMN